MSGPHATGRPDPTPPGGAWERGDDRPNVRDQIVALRRERIAAEGHALRADVPTERAAPLVRFLREPPLICEIKRRSPSRGAISVDLDPVELAGRYAERGVRSVSVLTEEDHFAGSLADLMAIKRAHPDLAVLRKDFLVDVEDVEVSYRAGADAILLIASVLRAEELAEMHACATELGMAALVELHDEEDFEKAGRLAPPLVGINARDLATFRVDLLSPVRLRNRITWRHRCIFESGVFTHGDALLVSASGFGGLLVGEAAVRDQEAIGGILAGLQGERPPGARRGDGAPALHPRADFWVRLMQRAREDRPLAKICGITNRVDAELAIGLGADVLGFNFADSPRRVEPALLEELGGVDGVRDALKVAVVVTGGDHGALPAEVGDLLERGLIDAVQFHGDEEPEECAARAFPYYKALRLGNPEAADEVGRYRSPRVLVDARDERAYGGTGKRVSPEVVAAVRRRVPLWLAGGLNDRNIASVASAYRPELVDVSSGVEAEPRRKDAAKLRRFFEELRYE
ncbi:MAG: bifunctional indole-3-glycerol phosphate synthase/phosphoribosylanthranilate isomerase [Spirochaetales bacterium]